jgi:hypothetical protein
MFSNSNSAGLWAAYDDTHLIHAMREKQVKGDKGRGRIRPVMFRSIPSGPTKNVGTIVVLIVSEKRFIVQNQRDKSLNW